MKKKKEKLESYDAEANWHFPMRPDQWAIEEKGQASGWPRFIFAIEMDRLVMLKYDMGKPIWAKLGQESV